MVFMNVTWGIYGGNVAGAGQRPRLLERAARASRQPAPSRVRCVETRSYPTRQSALLGPEVAGGSLVESVACLVRRVLTPLLKAA